MARRPKPTIAPPPIPPPQLTTRDLAAEHKITADLQALVVQLEQRCLDNAILLAHQAARRQGPLVAHFMELGRRYQETLKAPQKPMLRVIKGGAVSEEARIEAAVAEHGSIIAAMRAGAI